MSALITGQCRRHGGFTTLLLVLTLLVAVVSLQAVSANQEIGSTSEGVCNGGEGDTTLGKCRNRTEAMKLKIIAIVSILVASMIGVCLPMFSRSVPTLHPNGNVFSIVKAFASGVILATGYMHVLPDSFEYLSSECLPKNPWSKFPFTTFVAMLSAVATQMVDSFAMSNYRKLNSRTSVRNYQDDTKDVANEDGMVGYGHAHGGHREDRDDGRGNDKSSVLMRNKVVAQILELGIVVHSVVIGVSMGASDNACTIKSLVAALCFHQLFEGMGLGGCIIQGEFGLKTNAIMAFFFSFTTPFGIGLGIGLSKVYSETSPTALIVVGLLNACSAGLLNYMALVNLIALDFMGPKLQGNMKLQTIAYVALLMGAGGMSVMAIWA